MHRDVALLKPQLGKGLLGKVATEKVPKAPENLAQTYRGTGKGHMTALLCQTEEAASHAALPRLKGLASICLYPLQTSPTPFLT